MAINSHHSEFNLESVIIKHNLRPDRPRFLPSVIPQSKGEGVKRLVEVVDGS